MCQQFRGHYPSQPDALIVVRNGDTDIEGVAVLRVSQHPRHRHQPVRFVTGKGGERDVVNAVDGVDQLPEGSTTEPSRRGPETHAL